MSTTYTMLKFVVQRSKRYKISILFALFLLIVSALVQFALPQVSQHILDVAIPNNDSNDLVLYLVYFVILTLLLLVLETLSTYLITKASQNTIRDLRNETYSHVLSQDMMYFEDHKTGDTMDRLNSDISQVQGLISNSTFAIFGSAITFVWVSIFMLLRDPLLYILIALSFPFLFIVNRYFNKKIKQTFKSVRQSSSKISQQLQVSLTMIPLIKNYVTEGKESKKFSDLVQVNTDANMKATTLQAIHGPILTMLDTGAYVIVLAYGAVGVMNGNLTIGAIVTYLSYLSMLQRPMKSLASMMNRLQQALVSFDRIQELLNSKPKIVNDPVAINLDLPITSVSFKEVSFSYDKQLPTLKNVSFELVLHGMTALVGSSGSGKTTITKLLNRFYDVDSGEVLINNTNVKNITLQSLRSSIGVVSQDIDIIDGTLYDNICYGSTNKTSKDIEQASMQANIYEFIKSLPKGFNTQVGERGFKLSGGQKQRIALARVFLKDAPILVLDEATASLDNESERAVHDSLDKLIDQKTSLVIAHRLSTIQHANQIIVLDKGEVVEVGTHEELLANKQRYYSIFNAQFRD